MTFFLPQTDCIGKGWDTTLNEPPPSGNTESLFSGNAMSLLSRYKDILW